MRAENKLNQSAILIAGAEFEYTIGIIYAVPTKTGATLCNTKLLEESLNVTARRENGR